MKTSQKQREDDLQAATPFVTLTRGAVQFETPKSPKPEENLARSNKVNKRFKTLMSIFETKNSPFMNRVSPIPELISEEISITITYKS